MAQEKISSLSERLADRFSRSADARTIFGDPVVQKDVTVIPVGSVRYVLGGGGGSGEKGEEGGGGGGAVKATPVGYIQMTEGKANFKRITSPLSTAQWFWLASLAGLFFTRQLFQISQEKQKRD